MIESNSSIGAFLTCPAKYNFTYNERLEGTGYMQALVYGSFVHAFIERLKGGNPEAPARAMEEVITRLANGSKESFERGQDMALSDFAMAEKVADIWDLHWKGHDGYFTQSQMEFSETEGEWRMDAGPERTLVGKRDGLIHHKGFDKFFLHEIKTSGEPDRETYKHKLQLDRQISVNIEAIRRAGKRCDGVIYDIIWKPALRLKKNETEAELAARKLEAIKENPANYFERLMVYRTDAELSGAMNDLGLQFGMMEHAKQMGYARNQGSCEKFGKLCQFFTLCLDNQPEARANFIVRDKRLPELSSEVQS